MSASLAQLISQFSRDAIQVQQRLNDDYQTQLTLPFLPNQYLLGDFSVKLRCRLEQQLKLKVGIEVDLLNLSVDMRFQRNAEEDSWIEVQVQQLPVTPPGEHSSSEAKFQDPPISQ